MKFYHIPIIVFFVVTLICSCQNSSQPQNEAATFVLHDTLPTDTLSPCTDTTTISKAFLLGQFDPSVDTNYVIIPTSMCKYKGLYCHRIPFEAFLAMRDSARKDGIRLIITSAFRTFNDQKEIWNTKWKAASYSHIKNPTTRDITKINAIMRYSSMPGTSRHHWGTELDFNSCKLSYWRSKEGQRAYQWLCDNAHKFGFYQPYTADPNRTGYAEEKWHWSYKAMSNKYLDAYIKTITAEDITDFRGSHLVDSLNIIQTYVLGVAR